jgi:glutamine synthetase
VYLTWGAANRMALIRIPASGTDGPLAKRLEYRAGDPLANPYLLFGLLLAAGLDGISHKLPAPPPSLENTDALSECELASRNISFLPESLEAALALALASGFIKETLGEALLAGFNKAKTAELKAWRSHISDWEINRYL